jgi:hypothetical protein
MKLWKGVLWEGFGEDLREMIWLASLVGALSALGVGLAVMVALALDNWPAWTMAAAEALNRLT